MASLAPGNGWLPSRVHAAHRSRAALPKRAGGETGNVYPFKPVRGGLTRPTRTVASRGILARMLATLVAEAARTGRSDAWLLGWCLLGLLTASVAWIALVATLFAAAVTIGLSWVNAAAALAAANALVGLLLVRSALRNARNLLQHEGTPSLKLSSTA